ncbi:hypothetical protein F4811DRAFT_306577 [Daldinia bambusicola]|nr:hypothetical protein F4811DRAFT_306577 [Daldinia bambusicola]
MDAAGLALTVTGCVLKLLAFSTDFVANAKEVYHNGATSRNIDLDIISKSIQSAAKSLDHQLDELTKEGQEQSIDPIQQDICTLATRASEIGKDIGLRLEKARVAPKSKRKTFKTVVRGMWDAKDIDAAEKQLNMMRDQINLRIIISMKNSLELSQNKQLARVLATLESVSTLMSESKENTTTIIQLLNQINNSISHPPRDINALIPRRHEISRRSKAVYPKTWQTKETSKITEDAILARLWYPTIYDREESIDVAYHKTLAWIYDNSTDVDRKCKWDSLVEFLRGESSMYWVTGKPGSGKSTLMKFLNEQPQTEEILNPWIGGRKLVRASFYFFYKGEIEQKSELGLVRSLLHEILSRRRELISRAFPGRFLTEVDRRSYTGLTLPEAKKALKKVLQDSPDICFFFTIDGLDEFDEDVSKTHVNSLIELTRILTTFRNVKVIVSSRPLPEFESGFMSYPRLRIHELTKGDIHHYVSEKLENHEHMQRLIKRDPTSAETLIDTMVSTSLGVFLWVRIVTESLLQGLTNNDGIDDLLQRLEGLPSDLQDLYSVILTKVDPRYRVQTCKLLDLVYYGTLDISDLSLLGLWFAERADHEMVLNTETKPLSPNEMADREAEIQCRLKSRCLGLAEVIEAPPDPSFVGATVGFLHRTVREFLEGPFWKEFSAAYCRPAFDPHTSLFYSAILLVKAYGIHPLRPRTDDNDMLQLISHVMKRARELQHINGKFQPELMQEFDSSVDMYLTKHISQNEAGDSPGENTHSMPIHWSNYWHKYLECIAPPSLEIGISYPPYDTHPNFLSFALASGLDSYVKECVKRHGPGVLAKEGLSLLGHALCFSYYGDPRASMVRFFLDNGCYPQQIFENMTVWHWFWHGLTHQAIEGIQVLRRRLSDALEIMRLMLNAGAEPNIFIPWVIAYPEDGSAAAKWDYCTPLSALTRLQAWLLGEKPTEKINQLLVNIKILVNLLKDKGGIDKATGLKVNPKSAQQTITRPKNSKVKSSWRRKLLASHWGMSF